MFREMRRKKQQLSQAECTEILEQGSYGVLSVSGDDGYPYGVPLNYLFADGRIYFHCAKEGHKLDALNRDSAASFCVVVEDRQVAQEYTTYFRSVIVFGRVCIVQEEARRRDVISRLAAKFHPTDSEAHRNEVIEREFALLCVLEMLPEHISGKEAIELVRSKNGKV